MSDSLQSRYHQVLEKVGEAQRQSIARGVRFPEPVQIVAVSKKKPVDQILELYELGHRDFGENYVQELVDKAKEVERQGVKDIRWHFIGHLQRNKVKLLLPYVFCIHTIDSSQLANEVNKRWKAAGRFDRLPVFVQVNLQNESTKSGIPSNQLSQLFEKLQKCDQLSVLGFMCIPEVGSGARVDSENPFAQLAAIREDAQDLTEGYLSMGMSADYVDAISYGATHVRVGSEIFGARE